MLATLAYTVPTQAHTERSDGRVQIPKERLGFVQGGGWLTCLQVAGGWRGVWLRSGGSRAGLVAWENRPLSPHPLPVACG